MAGRASIVGAAVTHVGNVRDHNEDAHFIDVDLGVFLVCDGMGGHAAGEVASDLAIQAIRKEWASPSLHAVAERWLECGTPEARKHLIDAIRAGVVAAHDSILAEADRDDAKSGMGTTLVGAVMVGGELVFAHAGDSRAYLVRDGISMQLTEDHTLLARLLAAGIDVDVSGEGSRFRSMLTNALGIGDEVKVSTFVVPLADGDRFLLCSDGVSEYVPENEVGDVLTKQSSPARAAQRLIDLALERGGSDNATAVVMRVLEAGETPLPADQRKKDDAAIGACALWGKRVTPQQRLRALRIAIPRDHSSGDRLPAYALGDRVAWILLDGEVVQDGEPLGPGALVYPESLLGAREQLPPPGRDALAVMRSDVRALAIRADDFRELCEDDSDLGEALLDSLAAMIARRKPRPAREPGPPVDPRGNTDPHLPALPRDAAPASEPAAVLPDEPTVPRASARGRQASEGAVIAPAPQRPSASLPPSRPSPPPPPLTRRASPSGPTSRPSPLPDELARAATEPPSRPSPLPAAFARAATEPGRPASRTNPPPVASATPAVRVNTVARPRTPTPGPGVAKDAAKDPAKASPQRPGVVRPGAVSLLGALGPPRSAAAPDTIPLRRRAESLRDLPAPAGDAAPRTSPSEPEIETYLEIEAELPPRASEQGNAGGAGELDLALSGVLARDLDEDHETVSITIERGGRRVTETTTETSAHTLTVTFSEPVDGEDLQRAITANDAAEVSGSISIPEDTPPPPPPRIRARRSSGGRSD